MILHKERDVFTVGKGNYGRLGHNNEKDCTMLKKIQFFHDNGIKIVDITAGGRHCFAWSRDSLYGWGFNFYYQLGECYGNNKDKFKPTKIDVGSFKDCVYNVSCGYFNTNVIMIEGVQPQSPIY